MNKMIFTKYAFSALFLATVFTSCSSDDDSSTPDAGKTEDVVSSPEPTAREQPTILQRQTALTRAFRQSLAMDLRHSQAPNGSVSRTSISSVFSIIREIMAAHRPIS